MVKPKSTTKKIKSKSKVEQSVSIRPANTPRRLKLNRRQARRVAKQTAKTKPKLVAAHRLWLQTWRQLWRHRRVFAGIVIIHTLLTLLLVRSFSSGVDVEGLLNNLQQALPGQGTVLVSLAFFSSLIGGIGKTTNEGATAYQILITIITSLALIWTLRNSTAKKGDKLTIKNAYYKSTTQLVPFILVFLLLCLQTLPLLITATIYTYATSQAGNVRPEDYMAWGLLFVLGLTWSLRMLSNSIWALYIVTLPAMTPLRAWRSSRQLARFRRWAIVRKLLFLPIAMLVSAALVMVPMVMWLPVLAGWLFLFLSMLALVLVHGYLYGLYRQLLQESKA